MTWLALALPAWAVDADGDGYHADDCNDTDPTIHPGASEGTVLDGLDQDCTGWADDVQVCAAGAPYASVQAGVDAAPDGFTVFVCPGTYAEHVQVVDRDIQLVAGGPGTILDGTNTGPALVVVRSRLSVLGFGMLRGASPGLGGGIACDDSELALVDSRVAQSSAASGGGLGAHDCMVGVSRTVFLGNTALSGDGGGIRIDGGGALVTDSVIAGNTAAQGGGIAFDSATARIEGSLVRGNTATDTSTEYVGGGGIHVDGSAEIVGNRIEDNHADMCGGGVYMRWGAGEISGNRFVGNTASDDGGGVFTDYSSPRLADNLFEDNDATDDAGGLRIYHGSSLIEDNAFRGNTAGDDGGGLKLSHSTNTIRRNVFEDNQTGDAGGGLELDNETSDVEDCTFVGNSAARGGGLHSWRDEGRIDITGALFLDNSASDCGGAMAFDNDERVVTVTGAWVEGNTADDGGGVCTEYFEQDSGIAEESEIVVQNSVFVDNTATDEGGAFFAKHGRILAQNVTALANGAADGTGMVADDNGTALSLNSVFAAGVGPSVVALDNGGVAVLRYTDFWGGSFVGLASPVGVGGNVSVAPMFVDPAGGDVHLDPASPLIDAGDPAVLDPDGTRSDMGAYGGPEANAAP